jgi:WD40 repeat protein
MPRGGRTFRVFVSSTFADLKLERNALQERVFPKLRELCQQHGARFQAIDLRWGVSAEAALDQQTMLICLEELRRCQQVTPRPNFIVLLGERYGWRPLPPRIPEREFALILPQLADEEREFLSHWYWRDDNAVPPEYCLQPRKLDLPEDASEQQRAAAQGREEREWEQTERRLRELLLGAVRSLDPAQVALRKYERSATEQEIIAGALEAEREQAFCYLRTIVRLPEDERAQQFRDLGEPAQLLEDLKARLRRELPGEHVYQYRAQWRDDGLTDAHLDALCARVQADLSAVILEELARTEEQDELTQEIKAHQAFGEERSRIFIGRQEALNAVRSYVNGESNHPLVIWGESGSGKSAFMARCGQLLKQKRPEAVMISRFIGATPASTDVRSLLESLCRQLAREHGQDEREVPSEYKALVEDFPKRLALATEQRPLLLLLDALDQLSPTDNAHSLQWLPRELPAHVQVVVSALQREGEAGNALGAARLRSPGSLLELRPMSPEDGEQILNTWLADAHRTLQPVQRQDVLSNFGQCGLPLYLRLAFEEARRWKSYDGLPTGADDTPGLSYSVEGILLDLFARLESPANHGKELTGKALGYLAAARHGLTEDELLDVLSADTQVMEEFRRRNPRSPEVGRLPVVLWSRLHDDLAPYLIERSADHTSLFGFYHRQLAEAVQTKYLTEEQAVPRHRALAEYFDAQPLWYGDGPDRTPNYRKVTELPHQQTEGQAWEGLERTLTGLPFIEAKCTAGMTYDLVADYVAAQSADLLRETRDAIQPFAQFVRGRSHVLVQRRVLTLQEAYNLAASGPVPEQAARLLDDPARPKRPWLRLVNRPPAASSRCLQVLEGHTGSVWAVAVTPEGRRAVSGSSDKTLRVWDLETGECLRVLEGHTDSVWAVAVTPEGRCAVSGSSDKTLRVWDLETGECVKVLEGHTDSVSAVAVTPEGRRALSAGSNDRTLRVWELETGECLQVLQGHTFRVDAVAVTSEGRRAVSGDADGTLRVWELENGQCLQVLEGHRLGGWAVAVTPEGRQAVSGGVDGTLRVWELETGECLQVLAGHTEWVRAVAVTPEGRRAISGSEDETLRVWDLERGKCLQVLEGHTQGVLAVAVTPEGRQAVSGGRDGTLRVWELETGERLQVLEGHTSGVDAVAVTPEGRRALSGGRDGTLRVWELETGECLQVLGGHTSRVDPVAVTPEGRRAVSAGSDDGTLRVWELETGECLQVLEGHTFRVDAVAVTPEGRRAVSAGSDDRTLRVWELETGECLQVLQGHTFRVDAVAVTPEGRRAVSGSWDDTLRVWDLETGECLRVLEGHTQSVWAVAVTPEGRRAVSGSSDKTLRVWDVENGQCLQVLAGHTSGVGAVAVTPEGRRAVSGSSDRTLRVWDLETGECLRVLEGHTSGVVTSEGRRVVSVSRDGPLRVRDAETGVELAYCYLDAALTAYSVAPDGAKIVTGNRNGRVCFLALENITLGPPVLTPWRSPLDSTFAFGCLLCRVWSEVPESALGTELPCPNCGKMVKLNPFVIEADWRPVAAAWRGDE